MKTIKLILLVIFSNGFVCFINGQSDTKHLQNPRIHAEKVIEEIKTGTLVVILPSNANKINELTKILKGNSLNKKQQLRIKNELFETVSRIDRQNSYLLDFFIKHYDFSTLRFVYDTSVVHLKKGITNNIFVNQNSLVDKNIQLTTPIGGYIRIGQADKQGTNILSMLVCDKDREVMNSPFPYNNLMPNNQNIDSERVLYEQVIEKTIFRLKNYYEKINTYRE